MRISSLGSQASVLEQLDRVLGSGEDPVRLGEDLFAVVDVLDTRHAFRRTVTEPPIPVESRVAVTRALLEGKIGPGALDLIDGAVRLRWSEGRDLTDALERAGVTAFVAMADRGGELDTLEDDLFRFHRIVDAAPALRDALSDPKTDVQSKRDLLHALLSGKVSASTQRIIDQAAVGRHRSFPATLANFQTVAAAFRDDIVATAYVASPLSDETKRRLAGALEGHYSHGVHVNVVVDPAVLGGARVVVSDEVLDGTVENRLSQARRRLAG